LKQKQPSDAINFLKIHWLFFLVAIGLLAPPLLIPAPLRKYLAKPRRNEPASVFSLLGLWQNWVDLARAAAGVYVLTELGIEVPSGVEGVATKALILEGCVLIATTVVQTIRSTSTIQFLAPIFYLSGVTLILPGYVPGGFAVFVGWLFALGGGKAIYQLPVMGIALGAVGSLLGLSLPLILNCGLIYLPLILAFMFRKELFFMMSLRRMVESSDSSKRPEPSEIGRQERAS
jgi:hypothetical protein